MSNTDGALAEMASHLTTRQAANEAGVSAQTIRRWALEGRVKAYRVGPRIMRIDSDSLEEMVRGL